MASASQSTLLSKPANPFVKGVYFYTGKSLYYIVDVLLENQYVILEDCYDLKKIMITEKEFRRMRKHYVETA